MGPKLEALLTGALQNQRESSPSLGLSPGTIRAIHQGLSAQAESARGDGRTPIVLCAATVRPYFYRLIHTSFPQVVVLSFTELPPDTEVEFLSTLEATDEN